MTNLTDNQKRDLIKELGNILETNEYDQISARVHVANELVSKVGECNESWCDNCEIRAALGGLCSEFLDFVYLD